MNNIEERIFLFKDEDVHWPWEGKPSFYTKAAEGEWAHTISIDSFPCYAHDRNLVIETAKKVEEAFPIKFQPKYYILPFDAAGQTNAYTDRGTKYSDEKNGESPAFSPVIVFAGKRIPLHPAMTRYLTAHEYGHVVQYWIEYMRGDKEESTTKFDKEYAEMRGIECNNSYGGRHWHSNIGEIIANDFRIAICGIENEFWPHPCEHPLKTQKVLDFWKEQKEKYSYNDNN